MKAQSIAIHLCTTSLRGEAHNYAEGCFKILLIEVLCKLYISKILLIRCGHGLWRRNLVRKRAFPCRLIFSRGELARIRVT